MTDGKYYIEILRNFTQIICYTGFIPERKSDIIKQISYILLMSFPGGGGLWRNGDAVCAAADCQKAGARSADWTIRFINGKLLIQKVRHRRKAGRNKNSI